MNIIDTLHPEGRLNDNLYPNIKKENIPSKSISTDKLDNDVLSLIGSLKPSGTDTSTNILAFTSNKGIYVATNNGHWYYWNGSKYADGGVYQSSEDINKLKQDVKTLENKANVYFDLSGTGVSNTTQFIEYLNTNQIDISNYMGKIMFYKNDYGDQRFIVIPTYEDREPEGYLISNDNIYKLYRPEQGVYDIIEYALKKDIGNLNVLTTTNKTNVVNAINEVNNKYFYISIINADNTAQLIEHLTTTNVNIGDYLGKIMIFKNHYGDKNFIIIPTYQYMHDSKGYLISDDNIYLINYGQEAYDIIEYALKKDIGNLTDLTTANKTNVVSAINEVNKTANNTDFELINLKEALYGYVLDTTEVEIESTIPSVAEVGGTSYNLSDNVRGLIKSVNGKTIKSENFDGLKSVEYERLEIKGKNGVVTSTLLPYPTTLKGIGTARDTLDVVEQANGLYRIDKVTRIGEVDMGTLSWVINNINHSNHVYKSEDLKNIAKKVLPYEKSNILCDRYTTETRVNTVSNQINNTISIGGVSGIDDILNVCDNSYTDADTLKNSLSGVMLQYELATPTTTTIATNLTKEEVMPLLELGGSVDIINSNSEFVNGSTTMEMVYRKIN